MGALPVGFNKLAKKKAAAMPLEAETTRRRPNLGAGLLLLVEGIPLQDIGGNQIHRNFNNSHKQIIDVNIPGQLGTVEGETEITEHIRSPKRFFLFLGQRAETISRLG